MADLHSAATFPTYRGNRPYLFASYAHKNGAQVFEILKTLHEKRYRIWYDEGIDPGNEWPDDIAQALENAAAFVVFVTPESMASENVKNEIQLALSLEIPFFAIHLQETELPTGLAMPMQSIQAIFHYNMEENAFAHKVATAFPEQLVGVPGEKPLKRNPKRRGRRISPGARSIAGKIAILVTAIIVLVVGAKFLFPDRGKSGGEPPEPSIAGEAIPIPKLPVQWDAELRDHIDSVADRGWDSPLGRMMYSHVVLAQEEHMPSDITVGWGLTKSGLAHQLSIDGSGKLTTSDLSVADARQKGIEAMAISHSAEDPLPTPYFEIVVLGDANLAVENRNGRLFLTGTVNCESRDPSIELREATMRCEVEAGGEQLADRTLELMHQLKIDRPPHGELALEFDLGSAEEVAGDQLFLDRRVFLRLNAFAVMGNPKIYRISNRLSALVDRESLKTAGLVQP